METSNTLDSRCVTAPESLWQDRLHKGIWPEPLSLWMAVFWLALFIIRPWEVLFPELEPLHVERVWALLTVAVVFGSGKLRLCNSFQTTAVIVFLLALGFSSMFAGDHAAAREVLYKYVTLVVFYFILLSVIRTPYQLLFIGSCYIVVMALYLGKAQFEYFVHGHCQYRMGVSRLAGIESTFGHPNSVASSAVLSLPILYFLWRFRRDFTRTWPDLWRNLFPWGLAVYFWLAVSSIVLTNSRSGMLGFVLFIFLSATAGKPFRRILPAVVVGGVLLAGVWGVMPEENKNRLRTVWDPAAGPANAQESTQGRIEGFKAGLEMFRRHPLAGVGIGSFVPYRLAHVDNVPLRAHNMVGELLGETGLIGCGAFILFVSGVFVNCRATNRLAGQYCHPAVDMLSELAITWRNTIWLLLFMGLSGHNLLRFNWLWAAAFVLLCRMFSEAACAEEELVRDEEHELCEREIPWTH